MINAVLIVVKEMSAPLLLSVKNIKVEFEVNKQFHLPWQKKETIKAVVGVSFTLNEGETL